MIRDAMDADVAAAAQEDAPRHAHIRSFVRRNGRTSAAQARFLAEMMPKIGVSYVPEPMDLEALFGRAAPKILEIGCGMGETTAQIAKAHPGNDYLCAEVHTPGVGNLCKLVSENGLSNVRIAQHDAVEITRDMIPEKSLSGIHIFFPDPWHKKRHHKRRLIQPPFVRLLADRLCSGGYLHCATDWEEYAEQMLETLAAEPMLENSIEGYAPRPAHRPLTKFENRGLRLGHGVRDLLFIRRASTNTDSGTP